jgi:hypothetical protein
MIFEIPIDRDLCLSGGAQGSDLQWGMCAGTAGHDVIHWSFDGHQVDAPVVEVVRLTDEQLAIADPFIKVASKRLNKQPPYRAWVKRLIQRNYYQVAWAQSVYAVTDIINNVPQGGTAWAIAMYLDRTCEHHCYVYDQTRASWYVWSDWDKAWLAIDSPPAPKGVWAGIGSRDLTTAGKVAIRELLNYTKSS